jgi:hypothetical protein
MEGLVIVAKHLHVTIKMGEVVALQVLGVDGAVICICTAQQCKCCSGWVNLCSASVQVSNASREQSCKSARTWQLHLL